MKIAIARGAAYLLAFCALVANAPESVCGAVLKVVPEKYHDLLTLGFLLAAYVAHAYGSRASVAATIAKSK